MPFASNTLYILIHIGLHTFFACIAMLNHTPTHLRSFSRSLIHFHAGERASTNECSCHISRLKRKKGINCCCCTYSKRFVMCSAIQCFPIRNVVGAVFFYCILIFFFAHLARTPQQRVQLVCEIRVRDVELIQQAHKNKHAFNANKREMGGGRKSLICTMYCVCVLVYCRRFHC